MQFPVMIELGPWELHPHLLFEGLAYFIGLRIFWLMRRRGTDPVQVANRIWVIAGAAAGGAIGSKLLYLLEDPARTLTELGNLAYLMGGKTVVGGLLGGLIGVEYVKRRIGERQSTGDLFTVPLMAGLIIGRVGCFLTGLADNTHGVATSLPVGIDFGDGIYRHPTQLYEIAFLLAGIGWVLWRRRRPYISGDLFRGFMIGYLLLRMGVEFIKPYPTPYAGLTAIQVACLAGLFYYGRDVARVIFPRKAVSHG